MTWIKNLSNLQIALLFSVAVHGVLLAVRFVDPEGFDRVFQDTPLEVILVNASSATRPEKPQAIAQRNLLGGGEAEAGRATSPLPPSALTEVGDSPEDAHRQIEQMQEVQNQLLAQVRRELALLPPPDPRRDEATPEAQAQAEKRRQLLQLLAEIEKRINDENARPRKRFVGPSTREAVSALYYDNLRRVIEDRGTRNFPESKGHKLYGELTMVITVDAAGRVIETEIVQPSKNSVLDRQALAIAKAAAPFGPFTREMKRQFDQLVVVSRFRFTRDEGMQAQMLDR